MIAFFEYTIYNLAKSFTSLLEVVLGSLETWKHCDNFVSISYFVHQQFFFCFLSVFVMKLSPVTAQTLAEVFILCVSWKVALGFHMILQNLSKASVEMLLKKH